MTKPNGKEGDTRKNMKKSKNEEQEYEAEKS